MTFCVFALLAGDLLEHFWGLLIWVALCEKLTKCGGTAEGV